VVVDNGGGGTSSEDMRVGVLEDDVGVRLLIPSGGLAF